MPEPVPTPTAEQIVIVGDIMMISDADEVLESVSSDSSQSISDAKWARTLDDIDRWDAIQYESGDLKKVGDIEFFEGVSIRTRLDFRNMIRQRYGLSILFYEGQGEAVPILSTLPWF